MTFIYCVCHFRENSHPIYKTALIGGQTGCPYLGTNRLSLFGDKHVVLIWGQTGCPYWGQTGYPYLGTNRLSLFGDKQVSLIGGQTGCPY